MILKCNYNILNKKNIFIAIFCATILCVNKALIASNFSIGAPDREHYIFRCLRRRKLRRKNLESSSWRKIRNDVSQSISMSYVTLPMLDYGTDL